MPSGTKNRGFASMDAEKQKEIARKGGRAAHEKGTAHEFTAHEARAAGRKGGERVSANREHMSRIGRIGGKRSANRRQQDRVGSAVGAGMHPGEAVAGTEGRPAEHHQTEARPGQHRGEMASSGGHESSHGMSHRGQAERGNHDESPDSGNGRERGDVFGSHEQMRDETEAAVPSR
jgi:general stress protein YciG